MRSTITCDVVVLMPEARVVHLLLQLRRTHAALSRTTAAGGPIAHFTNGVDFIGPSCDLLYSVKSITTSSTGQHGVQIRAAATATSVASYYESSATTSSSASTSLIHHLSPQRNPLSSKYHAPPPPQTVLTFASPAPQHRIQQPQPPLHLQRDQPKDHHRNPQTLPTPIQESSRHAPTRPRPTPTRLHLHLRHERSRQNPRNATYARLRSRHLLHHVQPVACRQVLRASLHHESVHAGWLWER